MRDEHVYPYKAPLETDASVKVPPVHPWERFPTCPKCNSSLGDNVPGFRTLFAAFGWRAQSFAWCKGDHDSTMKHQANVMGGIQIQVEAPVECFGIFIEHLHVVCGKCRYRWLMECAVPRTDSFWRDFGGFAKWFFIVFGAVTFVFLLIANLISH